MTGAPRRRRPPLRNCVGCRGNPRRTYSRHYLCHECSKGVTLPTDPAITQLRELPGESFEDLFVLPSACAVCGGAGCEFCAKAPEAA